MFQNFGLLLLARVVVACDLNCIMLNVAFLLVLVDVSVYVCVPEKKKRFELSVQKNWQNTIKERKWRKKGTGIKFCAHQYMYTSEYLGLGLGHTLYLPPLE